MLTVTREKIFTRNSNPGVEDVNRAYQLAGLPIPNREHAIDSLVFNQPTTHEVAHELAQTALTATDPEKAYAAALEKIKNAIAADQLRTVYLAVSEGAHRDALPAVRDKAVKDLCKAFAKTVEQIHKASAALDSEDPFSLDLAIERDATREYKTLIAAISQLGTYASIHYTRFRQNVPGALAQVLSIVNIPDLEIELVERGYGGQVTRVINDTDTADTRTVRRLGEALERNTDKALVDIANGKYPNVTFELATNDDIERRIQQAANAGVQRTA